MIHYKNVQDFLSQESIAVVGVSRSEKKFGSMVYAALKEKGYRVFAVNPNMQSIGSDRCHPHLNALPEKVDGVVMVVPPSVTEEMVQIANTIGIRHIWMQRGSESKKAIEYCLDNGINVIHGECIMMYAQPVESFHRFHRLIWRLLGKIPRTTNGKHVPA
jgi:predicted CoA-binding protein